MSKRSFQEYSTICTEALNEDHPTGLLAPGANLEACVCCAGGQDRGDLTCCDKCPRVFCKACLGDGAPAEGKSFYDCGSCTKPLGAAALVAHLMSKQQGWYKQPEGRVIRDIQYCPACCKFVGISKSGRLREHHGSGAKECLGPSWYKEGRTIHVPGGLDKLAAADLDQQPGECQGLCKRGRSSGAGGGAAPGAAACAASGAAAAAQPVPAGAPASPLAAQAALAVAATPAAAAALPSQAALAGPAAPSSSGGQEAKGEAKDEAKDEAKGEAKDEALGGWDDVE